MKSLLLPGAEQAWSFDLPAALPQTVVVDERQPTTLFVAAKRGGLVVLRDEGDRAEELARLDATEFDVHHVMNLDQRGDLLVAALGDSICTPWCKYCSPDAEFLREH